MTHVRIILISVLWAFAASTAISRVEPYEDWLLRTGFTNEARASYLRALYSAGSPVSRDSLRLQVAYTFQRADEFESMMAWLERDPAETPAGQGEIALLVGMACISQGLYSQAVDSLSRAVQEPRTIDAAHFHKGRALACQVMPENALQEWSQISPTSPHAEPAMEFSKLISSLGLPNQKSPLLAGVLGIAPGAGYAYAGHPHTALSALLVLGVLGWATERSYATENPGLGAFLTFVTGGWYAGSIYGSAEAANRFNDHELSRYQSNFIFGRTP
jgi:hypothetical protein